MKKIHFDNLNKQNYWKYILIVAVAMIFAGMFKPVNTVNDKIYTALSIIGILTPIVYLSRIFWFRNIVQWNQKGVIIKLERYTKSIKFEDIKKVRKEGNIIFILDHDEDEIEFNFEGYDKNSINRIVEILSERNND